MLADRIKLARTAAGLTQKQLARKARVVQSVISDLETGKVKETAHIVRIALACGVSAYWLDKGGGPMKVLSDAERLFLTASPDVQAQAGAFIEGMQKRLPPS